MACQAVNALAEAALTDVSVDSLLKLLILEAQDSVDSLYRLLNSDDTIYGCETDTIAPNTVTQSEVAYHSMNAIAEVAMADLYMDSWLKQLISEAQYSVTCICGLIHSHNIANGE